MEPGEGRFFRKAQMARKPVPISTAPTGAKLA